MRRGGKRGGQAASLAWAQGQRGRGGRARTEAAALLQTQGRPGNLAEPLGVFAVLTRGPTEAPSLHARTVHDPLPGRTIASVGRQLKVCRYWMGYVAHTGVLVTFTWAGGRAELSIAGVNWVMAKCNSYTAAQHA